jgi:hypothetical protein
MQLHLKMKKQTMSDNSEEKHEYLTQNLIFLNEIKTNLHQLGLDKIF